MPGRVRVGTLLAAVVALVSLFATDRLLGHITSSRTHGVRDQRRAAEARLHELLHEVKVLRNKRAELDRSVTEMRAEMEELRATAPPAAAGQAELAVAAAAAAAAAGDAQSEEEEAAEDASLPPPAFAKNAVVSDPPFCRPSSAGAVGGLPKFVFVAGVEGSGHHALKDVWRSLSSSGVGLEIVVYDQLFHSLGVENHASYHYSSILQSAYMEHMAPVFRRAAAEGKVVIDAQNSYPMGKGAGALAHPDLLKLAALDGVLFDLRVIVLYRNPVDAVLSAVRRFQNQEEYLYKNEEFQARMIAESLATINNAIPHMPCGRVMVIDYATLVSRPDDFVAPLSQLIGVESATLAGAFAGLHPPDKPPDSPEKAAKRSKLRGFFDVQQVLWPLLAGG